MMLWKGRPATRDGGLRRLSTIEAHDSGGEHSTDQGLFPTTSTDLVNIETAHAIGSLPFEHESQSLDATPMSKNWLADQDLVQEHSKNDSPIQSDKNKRPFSLMKLRHASDPQLSTSYATSEASQLNMPTPTIITTSPTQQNLDSPPKQKPKRKLFGRPHAPFQRHSERLQKKYPLEEAAPSTNNLSPEGAGTSAASQHVSFEEPETSSVIQGTGAPPAYGDDSQSSLAIPISRLSESSRSDGSSGEPGIYAQTTTTHTISTTTTFFRMPRRKKNKGPLFPLPAKLPAPDPSKNGAAGTPRGSTSLRPSVSPERVPAIKPSSDDVGFGSHQASPFPSPTHSTLALTNAPDGAPGPAIFRKDSSMSQRSGMSTPSLQVPPPRLGHRGRSSTMGSLRKSTEKEVEDSPPLLTPSGRNSSSTTGRKSFGDLFSLSHRLRQNSAPPPHHASGVPGTPGSTGSKATSFQIPREYSYPERNDEDTPTSYLAKLEAAVPRGVMAAILCKGSDEFSKICLRKYMRGFSYFVDSIDMAIRKMLMEVELPKETQQIDRLLQGFADRYCECNPGMFVSVDEAYFVAFSILLLHSDTHNKNNKRKMQRQDYVKNTQDQVEVSHDILECFYDNVSYTPFIHFEDEVAVNSHRLAVPKRKGLFRTPSSESLRGPVDPYALILDSRLDVLRPSLKEVMDTEDTYNTLGTAPTLDVLGLHDAFFRSGILQIVSARSRPDAFLTQATISNPAEAQAGLVDIKAAKVGLLWRKDPKKKKTKSPWQEWGAILTSSQLYFFRDVGWIKRLIAQHESHQNRDDPSGPVLFRPPLTKFEPDALMSMDDAVALLDSSYKKHKNAFVFIKHGGFEEVFLANDEADMNDWIAKLNYAATFRTAGVRMRGHIGPTYGGQKPRMTRGSFSGVEDANTPLLADGNTQLMVDVMAYRHRIMDEKINEATEKLAIAQKGLDGLLRNARHLQVLTPIQARTRESLVLAAGRMSAKLKWTRVEMSRTKCHRDILKLDIDYGDGVIQSTERSTLRSPPSKTTPTKTNQRLSSGSFSTISEVPTASKSPVLAPRPIVNPQVTVDKTKNADLITQSVSSTSSHASHHRSTSSLEVPSAGELASTNSSWEGIHLATTSPGSPSLVHQISIVSSHRRTSDPNSRVTSPTLDLDDGEAQVLREAGLLGKDSSPLSHKRPDTSESDRDRVGAISPTETPVKDRNGVRRSLHRTLRDSPHGPHLPHHHRSKRGRDSNSSVVVTEDGSKTISGDSDGLTRGTGSFIVHGKKASVITFGSEWQKMSNEERLKLRKLAQNDDTKEENAIEDGTASNVSVHSAIGGIKTRTNSTVTAGTDRGEDFVEAEENKSLYDAKEGAEEFEDVRNIVGPSSELGHNPHRQALQV